jgi:hypothetical protein
VIFISSRGTCCYVVHLEPYTWVGATVVLLDSWLEVFWVSVIWTSLGPLPRWVPELTTWWAPRTTRLVLHGT